MVSVVTSQLEIALKYGITTLSSLVPPPTARAPESITTSPMSRDLMRSYNSALASTIGEYIRL